MQTGLNLRPITEVIADALVVLAFEQEHPRLELTADKWIADLYESGEFTGEKFKTTVLHRPEKLKARRLVLAGCGKPEDFNSTELRKVTGAAVRTVRSKAIHRIALVLPTGQQTAETIEAAIEGAVAGAYDPDFYKTDPKKEEVKIESFSLVVPGGDPVLEEALRRGRIIAEAQNFTRDLAAEPANAMTPTVLAEKAREMAADQGLEYEILDRDRMQQLGMGALLGVAQGSAEPPALIIIRYKPEGESDSKAHLGLVGKGVTFDTGGISIKPSEKMEEMKYDMCGAAAVLGAMRAIAQLKPSIPVTAVAPAVENMPGSRAQRPGDVVTSLSGKTVEVLNTDAEGRLILADALTYAQRLGCTHLIDVATLTGAVVVALGHVHTGAFTNNQELLGRVMTSARAEGEKTWQMPLDEEYKDLLKSSIADLPNIGPRWGGAITAAYFLKEFADPAPWVHLDVAGTAWLDESKPFLAKGPTGVSVRTMVHMAANWLKE